MLTRKPTGRIRRLAPLSLSANFSAQPELKDIFAFFRLAVPDENGHDLFFFFAGI